MMISYSNNDENYTVHRVVYNDSNDMHDNPNGCLLSASDDLWSPTIDCGCSW